jgi:hypothetical protein
MTDALAPTAILVNSPQDITMNSAHLSGPTSPTPMSGVSAAPSLQYVPIPTEGRASEALITRTGSQPARKSQESSLRRSESSELSSLSQDGDFLTGRPSGSPSDGPKIKLKIEALQRRSSSSRLSSASRGDDALNYPDESPDDLEDSDSDFELEDDEDPGREMRSLASRPRSSRTGTDLQAIPARDAPLTRRASIPHGSSRPTANGHIGSRRLGERGKRGKRKPPGVIAQLGEKFDGGTVTKKGKGWIVIEESDDEEVPVASELSGTVALPAIHPHSPSPRIGNKRKRKSSAPHAYGPHLPSSMTGAQPPPAKKVARPSERNSPDIGELRRLVIRRLSESLSELV